MKRFVEAIDRAQSMLFTECLEDWIAEDNPVRVIDVFVDELDLAELGFSGVTPEVTGRPSYHPSVLLKLYIYGYLNRVQSSRRLEPVLTRPRPIAVIVAVDVLAAACTKKAVSTRCELVLDQQVAMSPA